MPEEEEEEEEEEERRRRRKKKKPVRDKSLPDLRQANKQKKMTNKVV